MATAEELTKLRTLVGRQLPVDGAEPQEYTDLQLDALLEHVPYCPMSHAQRGRPDLYGVAAMVWEDKALQREVELATEGAGQGPLVTSVKQGSASLSLARPTPLHAMDGLANDPAAMRALAARLRRRSCHAGVISHRVLPPDEVRTGRTGVREYDGGDSLYTAPRPAILHDSSNPDHVVNLPEAD